MATKRYKVMLDSSAVGYETVIADAYSIQGSGTGQEVYQFKNLGDMVFEVPFNRVVFIKVIQEPNTAATLDVANPEFEVDEKAFKRA